jgi:hypothetical protein
MFSLTSQGDYAKTEQFLMKMVKGEIFSRLDQYGAMGVAALSAATPVDSGTLAHSWSYEIVGGGNYPTIVWTSSDMAGGTPLAVMIQYGHGTGTGGYVEGRDFINPAMRPVMDKIAEDVWKVVTSA